VNGSVPIGAACEYPYVALPAPLKASTYPEGNEFDEMYSLTAQPDAAPLASRTSSTGAVPPVQCVAVPETAHPLKVPADALAHWSYPVCNIPQFRLGELSSDRVPAVTVSVALTVHDEAPTVLEQAVADAGGELSYANPINKTAPRATVARSDPRSLVPG